MSSNIEVICTLNDQEFHKRRAWVREHIAPSLVSIKKTGDGLRLTYPADPGTRGLVEEFAVLERQCCGGFLTFTIADGETSGRFELLIAGPGHVQDMLLDLKKRIETENVP